MELLYHEIRDLLTWQMPRFSKSVASVCNKSLMAILSKKDKYFIKNNFLSNSNRGVLRALKSLFLFPTNT